MQTAPRIVLSEDAGSEDEPLDEEGSETGGDDSNDIDDTVDETQDLSAPRTNGDGNEQQLEFEAAKATEGNDASPGLAVASERPRKTRSTYRDSVFTSYSIYADCFDNMKLESQSSAASMVKRQSMHLLGQPSASSSDAGVTEAKATDA